jgi:NADH-quinone oxidoreductase subunit G
LDLIEVMACPGGCIGGAGQPVSREREAKRLRTRGLYEADKHLDLHKSQENHHVTEMYQKYLGEIGGRKAHHLLHTHYQNRRRMAEERLVFGDSGAGERLKVSVCAGTNCFVKGSQQVLRDVLQCVETEQLQDKVEVSVSFCFEQCGQGPTVRVGEQQLQHCTGPKACAAIHEQLKAPAPPA